MVRQKKILSALRCYDFIWRLCIPLLRFNSRLKDGYDSRCSGNNLKPADIWIQAASAGEAYLAWSLLENLRPVQPVNILVTTNTRQGLDIIKKAIDAIVPDNHHITADCAFVPFDRPAIMESAVYKINPKMMILLETEIWPGLLFALKKLDRKIIIINGRLTPKNLGRYMLWPSFWQALRPDKILAISEADANRFAALFGQKTVQTMHNIKFDRLNTMVENKENPLKSFLPPASPVLILGSVRKEEEDQIINIITDIFLKCPETIIGLFPRHMHRISYWEHTLNRMNVRWKLRSALTEKPVENGTIILWDTFGELNLAYALAKAVFVGGSLAPLGGQNFLEPMIYGITPVIGPFWENFAWVGADIFKQGLAIKANNWQSVTSELVNQLQDSRPGEELQEAAIRYITDRKGGTAQACGMIMKELES
ncbi:MAG: 3-deoxy-D-manno-octulosonic acid transferase [Dissulfuribacterales bacterium]